MGAINIDWNSKYALKLIKSALKNKKVLMGTDRDTLINKSTRYPYLDDNGILYFDTQQINRTPAIVGRAIVGRTIAGSYDQYMTDAIAGLGIVDIAIVGSGTESLTPAIVGRAIVGRTIAGSSTRYMTDATIDKAICGMAIAGNAS